MSPPSETSSILQCISLTKVFRDFWNRAKVLAVDNLTLDVRPGEIFGLLGPNGSGKSTTIKILLGLLYPTSGAARIFGSPPTDVAIKSRIGFMPEESYLYKYLNARETLDYYGRLFHLDRVERRRRIDQLIEMVGLKRAAHRPVGTYSKGMARRIGLAQALINDPDLLILDEPTTGLDPIGTRQIKDVIETLGNRGKTVVLSSHLLADVEDVCHRVAILYGGRLQALGSVSELLERRDVTQFTARQLAPAAIEQVRQIVEKNGSELISVEHPTDRLEAMFLRVVGQAQRDRLSTSGAEATVGVSQFLGGKVESGAEMATVESLVEAGRTPQQKPVTNPVPAQAPVPKKEILTQLTETKPVPASSAEKPASPPPSIHTDTAVLDRLLKGSPPQSASPGQEHRP